jgi:hypothetical protein
MASGSTVVGLDRGNNTTCTINLHGNLIYSTNGLKNDLHVYRSYCNNAIILLRNVILIPIATGATVVSWRVNNQEQIFVRFV